MKLDVTAVSAAAKKRIATNLGDERDQVIVALLTSTSAALLSAAEHMKKTDIQAQQLKEALEQVRTLTRENDMMATKMARMTSMSTPTVQ